MDDSFWIMESPVFIEVLSPREALNKHGDMALSEYVGILDSFSLNRDALSEMSHEQIVWEHLKHIGPLSQKAAALHYDIWRLASTVGRLKKKLAKEDKYTVCAELLPTKRGGQYAEYSLIDASNDNDEGDDICAALV